MKKIIILVLVLSSSCASFSQQTKTLKPLTREQYLKKGRHQNTAAWSLLLGGFGLEVLAFAIAYETELGANLLRAGFLANLTSIPLFIAARRNKKKSMSLSFKNESTRHLQNGSLTYRAVPSLTFKINL